MSRIVKYIRDNVYEAQHRLVLFEDQEQKRLRRRLNSCKTYDEFWPLYNHIVVRSKQDNKPYHFRYPPIPGTENIVPITTDKGLDEEGEIMEHCVGSYLFEVEFNNSYVYKVLKPQRATLCIEKADDRYKIKELKLKGNDEPSTETYRFVENWLNQ